MSLKFFHIVFVTAAIIFTLAFGIWGVRDFLASGSTVNLIMGIGSFAGAAGLAGYGVWFLRKFKDMGGFL